jgi:hypothetical protein
MCLSPPGTLIVTGTKYESAEKNVFPASPDAGTRITGIPPTNVVVAEEAIELMKSGNSGKIVLDWSGL